VLAYAHDLLSFFYGKEISNIRIKGKPVQWDDHELKYLDSLLILVVDLL